MKAWADEGGEEGNALVEFTFLAILLLVPLAYIVVAVFTLQKAAFAVTAATREAGRAYVTTTAGDPGARAAASAALAMSDQGLSMPAGALTLACDGLCGAPGSTIRVALDYTVVLPLVPRALGGHPLGGIVVHGRHAEIVDKYRPAIP